MDKLFPFCERLPSTSALRLEPSRSAQPTRFSTPNVTFSLVLAAWSKFALARTTCDAPSVLSLLAFVDWHLMFGAPLDVGIRGLEATQ